MWNNLDDDEKLSVFELHNFNKEIFFKVTGIDVTNDYNKIIK